MNLLEIYLDNKNHLSIDKFREMDFISVREYKIPIELMMENAGLQLARLVAGINPQNEKILIGAGTGNNGGGGLVAARRLAGWGYDVSIHIPDDDLNDLAAIQLERAISSGANSEGMEDPGVFLDCYLGFSQRLPLSVTLQEAVEKANNYKAHKISLDLPTGLNKETAESIFKPDAILTLAAMKTELIPVLERARIFVADLGLPSVVYKHFGIKQYPGFRESGILECKTNRTKR